MNKSDLVKYISDKTLITEKDAGIIVDVLLNGIKEGLYKGERIRLRDFGSFFLQSRKARKALNPRTQQEIDVPAKTVVRFKEAKELHERINNV